MELHHGVLDILELVETATGYPVEVTAMPALDTLVTVHVARGRSPVHRVLVRPGSALAPDYLVGRECGRILRLFAVPPEDRFELAPAPAGREAVARMLHAADGIVHRYRLAEAQAERLCDQLYGGLVLQLRSTPVGLRVDRWLSASFADLTDMQRQSVAGELAEGRSMLSDEVRAMTPPGALLATLAMHAAEADYWARAWAEPELLEPYRATGSFRDGRALMRVWREVPDEPPYDRELVDAWAEMIGMSGWFQWRPYASPRRD